jgi:hypothetical protein
VDLVLKKLNEISIVLLVSCVSSTFLEKGQEERRRRDEATNMIDKESQSKTATTRMIGKIATILRRNYDYNLQLYASLLMCLNPEHFDLII